MTKITAKMLTAATLVQLHAYLILFAGGFSNAPKFEGICSRENRLSAPNLDNFGLVFTEVEKRAEKGTNIYKVKGKAFHELAAENCNYFAKVARNKAAAAEKKAAKEEKKNAA